MKIKVSNFIADFMARNDIVDVFTITGGGAMHLNDAFGHHAGLRCTYNHHEQASAVAAEAYARLTGKIALVCVTSGPGGTNAITGVIGGWLDSVPMFVISGQVKKETTICSVPELGLRQLGDQEFDIVHTVANMTKYCAMVTKPNEIAYHLEKALFYAYNGRPGPVWLDIPLDVQGAQIETDELSHFKVGEENCPTVPLLSAEQARDILRCIHEAKAPLILTGTGIRGGGAEDQFLRLTEKLKIPVVTAWNANDTLAFDSPYFAGMPGTVGQRGGNFAVQNCDLLLSLGCRMNIRMISYNKLQFAKNAYKIIVDIDEKELRKPTIKPDMPVCADVRQVIDRLLEEEYVPHPEHGKWLKWCKDINARFPVVLPSYHHTQLPINPYVFIDQLFLSLASDDDIICGNGSACVVTFQAAKIKQGQRMFTNSGCAAMGYGLPAALGVAVAERGKRIVCIDGDGSIMMNLQELQTISHNRLNVKIFVLNNNGYHSIRQTQKNLFKPPLVGVSPENGVGFPDFGKLASAFGIGYERIENEENALQCIKYVLAADMPILCEVVVDETQSFEPKLSSKVLPDGRIVSSELDDMFPFLSREDYEGCRYR